MWGKSVVRAGKFTFEDSNSKVFSITALKMCLFHIIATLYVTSALEIIILPSELRVVNYFLREPCIEPGDSAQVRLKFPEGSWTCLSVWADLWGWREPRWDSSASAWDSGLVLAQISQQSLRNMNLPKLPMNQMFVKICAKWNSERSHPGCRCCWWGFHPARQQWKWFRCGFPPLKDWEPQNWLLRPCFTLLQTLALPVVWGITVPAFLPERLWSLSPALARSPTGTNFWVACAREEEDISDLIYERAPTQANEETEAAQMAKACLYKEPNGKIKSPLEQKDYTFCFGNHTRQLENKIFLPIWRCVDMAPFPPAFPAW